MKHRNLKDEKTLVIARANLLPNAVKIRCHAEKDDVVAGFLTEFRENLEDIITAKKGLSKDMTFGYPPNDVMLN